MVDQRAYGLPGFLRVRTTHVELIRHVRASAGDNADGLFHLGRSLSARVWAQALKRDTNSEPASSDDLCLPVFDCRDRASNAELDRHDRISRGQWHLHGQGFAELVKSVLCLQGALGRCAEAPVTLAFCSVCCRGDTAVMLVSASFAKLFPERPKLGARTFELSLGLGDG